MRVLNIIAISLLLYGCAFFIIDHSEEQKELLQSCFMIKKSAFLYEARCVDLDGSGKLCTSIQGFDPLPYVRKDSTVYEYHYPKSWVDYLRNRAEWDKKLFRPTLFSRQRTIIAPIEVGTKIQIVGVYGYPRGEIGHVLIVTARITSGSFKDTVVELPPAYGPNDDGPDWTTQRFYSSKEGVELTKEYLEPCSVRSL